VIAPMFVHSSRVQLVQIRTFSDARGSLSVVEQGTDLPFVPRRLYYLHGGSPSQLRGAHAHKELQQFMIAFAGRVDIEVDDGFSRQTITLDRPDQGLLIKPVIWRTITPYSPSAVLGVLVSDLYDADDYIHDYQDFRALAETRNK
jgi:TDP-4-oxo-6-deoxy-alpha-D-glucose-3,4-oxoisomerase